MFDLDASSITNRDEGLDIVIPMAAKQLHDLVEGETNLDKIKLRLDQYFLKKVAPTDSIMDKRLYNAIMIILREHGALNLKSEIDVGISPRQLRRLFEFYVGTSPKKFSKAIRFQYFFQLLSSQKVNVIRKFSWMQVITISRISTGTLRHSLALLSLKRCVLNNVRFVQDIHISFSHLWLINVSHESNNNFCNNCCIESPQFCPTARKQ